MLKNSDCLAAWIGLLVGCGGTVDVGLGTGRLAEDSTGESQEGGAATGRNCGTLDDATCQGTAGCIYVSGAGCGTQGQGTALTSECRGVSQDECQAMADCAWDIYNQSCFVDCTGFDDSQCQSTFGCVSFPGVPCGTRIPGSVDSWLNCSTLDEATCAAISTCTAAIGEAGAPCGYALPIPDNCGGLSEITCKTSPNCTYVYGWGCLMNPQDDPCAEWTARATCESTPGCMYIVPFGCASVLGDSGAGSSTDAAAD
ncbi:MAG: hypothetical protein ABTD50_21420 [Polyangiaceae bacterium]|jgi:hypothetical protein